MKKITGLFAICLVTAATVAGQDLAGNWMGTLDVNGAKLRLAVHLEREARGFTATVDSPDQGANGLPVTSVRLEGESFALEMKQLGARFDGTVSKDGGTIDGKWSQGGASLPLTLKRTEGAAEVERRRPQTPTKPYPYREEAVAYENKAARIRFSATLTIPTGPGPFPAVLLITGSGPQDRDETILGHRPFLVLADYLTRHGIAVLRADDRGVGKSGGNFGTATTADFAKDADAGVVYLKTRSEVDPKRIGLVGHSEGGIIAPMIAARDPQIRFIVLLAGPGVPLAQILVEQQRLILQASGISATEIEKRSKQEQSLLTAVRENSDNVQLEQRLKQELASTLPESQIATQIKALESPWLRYLLDYDPAATLRKVKCPVLVLNGGKDLQVPPEQNLPPIRAALKAGANLDFEVDEFPDLNHLFQTAKTGAPSEYASIEETMSPTVLAKIASWITQH